MKNTLSFCLLLVSFCCIAQKNNTSAKKDSIDDNHWRYFDEEDKMTSGKTHKAAVFSINKLQLKSPPDENTKIHLFIQNYEGANTFALVLDKGRFNETTDGNINLRIRFDEEQPAYYNFHSFKGNVNSAYLAYAEANKMIEKVKKAKRIRIELDFDNTGSQIIEFNVAGLKWDYPAKEKGDNIPGN